MFLIVKQTNRLLTIGNSDQKNNIKQFTISRGSGNNKNSEQGSSELFVCLNGVTSNGIIIQI